MQHNSKELLNGSVPGLSQGEHGTRCAAFERRRRHPARPENNHKGRSRPRLLSAGAAETAHNVKAVMGGILCVDGVFHTRRRLLFHAGRRAPVPGKPSQINRTKGDERDLLTVISLQNEDFMSGRKFLLRLTGCSAQADGTRRGAEGVKTTWRVLHLPTASLWDAPAPEEREGSEEADQPEHTLT